MRLQVRRQIGRGEIKHRFYGDARWTFTTGSGRFWNRQPRGKKNMQKINDFGASQGEAPASAQHLQSFPVQQFPGQQFPLQLMKANEKPNDPNENLSFPMIRVAWLKQHGRERAKSARLLNRFSNAGMKISVVEINGGYNPLMDQIPGFDLILMEYFDHLETEMRAALSKIRTESRAPLMMLTDAQTPEWSVNALKAGADAIFTLNTPEDVILARCNALLRRWLPQT